MCFPLKDEKSFLAIMDTLFLQQQPLPKNSLLTFLGHSHYPGEGTQGKALSFKQRH